MNALGSIGVMMHDSDERVQEKRTIADERSRTGIRLSNVGHSCDGHRSGARYPRSSDTRTPGVLGTLPKDRWKMITSGQHHANPSFIPCSRNVRVRQTPGRDTLVRLGNPMPRQPPYIRSRARTRRVIRFPVSAKHRTRIGSPARVSRSAAPTNGFVINA